MCGRFQIDTNKEEIEKHYGIKLSTSFKPRYNIAPSQKIQIVTDDKIEEMKWGLPLKFGKKVVRNLINIRDDSLSKGWAKQYLMKRCLVPTTGYYEWKKTNKEKIPYYFGMSNHEIFSFAGLYDDEGNFGIITTDANNQAANVHDRMPAILYGAEEKEWVNADTTELNTLKTLIHPFRYNLTNYPISKKINTPSNDTPDTIEPLN